MRLISLSASEPSFKKIVFNPTGASFILAKQANPEQQDKRRTYNGVGKSLLVALVDYCLGSKSTKGISKALKEKLPGWSFSLVVEIKKRHLTIERHTSFPETIFLDGEELKLKDFHKRIEGSCFKVPPEISGLSFRALLPFFLRALRKSYLRYDRPVVEANSYHIQLYNAFLLGLDVGLAQAKMSTKVSYDETKRLHKNVKNDPILKMYFEGDRDPSLALADLNEQIENLEDDLQRFEIADDYYQIKESADDTKRVLDKVQNKIVLKRISVDNINKSLEIAPDIKRDDIKRIYDESKLVFQSSVERQLSELESFYNELAANRSQRLLSQKRTILTDMKQLEDKLISLKSELDSQLKYLDTHQALDVFTKLSSKLADLKHQREKLLGFEKVQHDFESKKTALKKDLLFQAEEAASYLEQVKNQIDRVMESFRSLARQFYPSSSAGVTVNNNTGENQIRYKIEAKIQSDSSDGINSVKLFCYDLTLLREGQNHAMKFVFHDSRLFSDIDEVHSNVLFSIVKKRFLKNLEYQYIASINQNQLTSLSSECREFIEENVVLELTDDSDDGKLLGRTVELEYDD